ncbi:MAG: SDR family NAD(P)-dependent oxidoreductase [Phycisphaerae bacterium]|nr:SDR family NAD(P)-dependent oxidoreductase [Phycisphaerae bacterium]NIP54345.1 SDR family NAD(P)-dependent oxidoreductase [Phycisphaerae bacterium]NIS53212.1 SDR family NAD(P)-dependent oxidoreductase [Phycisphaerae bacterium]NIU10698.1 SDR family NAD(P)-dependent oxidoreductase [Phycisphaerae bacterium]NIU58466.1 SDR family NAD(P)-dependent oxidoreductase [Phycisphaerae bacterium]
MKALVTGGAGFIGSHLAEQLLNDGNKVVVVDNLSTGSLRNIENFQNKGDFEFVEGDICNANLIDGLVEQSEAVFHLAAAVGVKLIADSPVHTIETNISGTEVVLDAVNKFKKSVFIASSSEIYGKNESAPFREDDDIVLGNTGVRRWSYACSKAIDEYLALAFHQQYGLHVVIGRFFNTIGPRQTGQYGMVVPRFVQWALKGEGLSIYGTGEQKRCFCYVGDVLDAVIGLMDSEEAAGGVYNIGSTEEIAIGGLADKIIEMTGSKSKKEFVPYEVAYGMPMEDMMRRVPSLERIKKAIGWEPKTNLTKTLEVIIESEKGKL